MKNPTYIFIALLPYFVICFYPLSMQAQTMSSEWVASNGGIEYDVEIKTVVDDKLNSISCGVFSKTADFDPSGNTVFKTSIGRGDCYIQKLKSDGSLKWAVAWGGKFDENIYAVAVDKAGNIYALGGFADTVDFDPGAAKKKLFTSNYAYFLLKLDSNGLFKWVKSIEGTIMGVSKLVITKDDHLLITGTYTGSVDFDPDAGITKLTVSTTMANDARNAFLCKFNSGNGALIWAKDFRTDKFSVDLTDVTIDHEGNILSCGFYDYIVDLDPGTGKSNHNVAGEGFQEAYISKLSQDGNFIWAKSFNANSMQAYTICTDLDNNVIIGGTFYGNVDFDPGSGDQSLGTNQSDQFIVKLNKFGTFVWVNQLMVGLYSTSFINSAACDNMNHIIIAGEFTDSVDFDPGISKYKLGSGKFIKSSFVAKYNSKGSLVFAKRFGNTKKPTKGIGAVIDKMGSLYHFGYFTDTVDFTLNSANKIKISEGAVDEFVLKLNCPITYSIQQSGGTLIATVTGASLQWFDCRTGLPLPNQVNKTFSPTANGSYFLVLNYGECTISSPCHTVNNVGLGKPLKLSFSIFPNPTHNELHFQAPNDVKFQISILDIQGRIIMETEVLSPNSSLDISEMPAGLYFARIKTKDAVSNSASFLKY